MYLSKDIPETVKDAGGTMRKDSARIYQTHCYTATVSQWKPGIPVVHTTLYRDN